jgi:toxin ParE1/3/4
MFDPAIEAVACIERPPGMGSPRLGESAEIPRLRSWRIAGFPMRWVYFEAATYIDVVRLLGDRQDILAILGAEG